MAVFKKNGVYFDNIIFTLLNAVSYDKVKSAPL